jgi:hypothetical protein
MFARIDVCTDACPSPAESVQILFRSFLFSQGRDSLQSDVFRYVHLVYPNWSLDARSKHMLQENVSPLCARFLSSGCHASDFPEKQIQEEVQRQINSLASILETDPVDRSVLLTRMLKTIIRRDFSYLSLRSGRPGSASRADQAHSITGRFFSHFCHFGLLHHSTGVAAFDQFFAELAASYEQRMAASTFWYKELSEVRHELLMLLSIHNQHYPQAPLTLPNAW